MRVFILEANGKTNTGEYVNAICNGLNTYQFLSINVFTSKNSFHESRAIEYFENYGKTNLIFRKVVAYIKGWNRILNDFKRRSSIDEPIIFHVHWLRLSPIDYYYLWRIYSLNKIKLVFTVHNILPHEKIFFDRFLYKRIYHLFDLLLFHNKQNIIDFQQQFPELKIRHSIVPHYSYNVEPFIPVIKDYVQILFFGAIRPYKGLDLLLEAFKNANFSIKTKLKIAGKAEYDISFLRKNYSEMTSKNKSVSWAIGWINKREIPQLFHESHIVVLPYKSIDNSGLVHLSMSYGKTVIVPDIGVFKDLIENEVNGMTFEIGNLQSLINCIEKTVYKCDFEKIGNNARKSMENCSIQNVTQKLFYNYKKVFSV